MFLAEGGRRRDEARDDDLDVRSLRGSEDTTGANSGTSCGFTFSSCAVTVSEWEEVETTEDWEGLRDSLWSRKEVSSVTTICLRDTEAAGWRALLYSAMMSWWSRVPEKVGSAG